MQTTQTKQASQMTLSQATASTPIYPSGLSRLPQPLLIEPVEVDTALARLLGTRPEPTPESKMNPIGKHTSAVQRGALREGDWSDLDWTHNDMSGMEVIEHPLPEGLDFAAFHALLRLAH